MRDFLVHESFNYALKARCLTWKEFGADGTASSRRGPARHENVKFLVSETLHTTEEVHCDGTTGILQAIISPCAVFYRPHKVTKVKLFLLENLFRLVLNIFEGKEALQSNEPRSFWNIIINKGPEL